MTVEETLLALVPFAVEDGFDADQLRSQLASEEVRSIASTLSSAIEHGQLTPQLWLAVTGSRLPVDFTASVGALWDSLVRAQVTDPCEGMPDGWTPDSLRLWAYTEEWTLLSQDEDLVLMDDDAIPELLQVAREPACPKREYILSIVAHWARDSAFAALGTELFSGVVARVAQLAPGAEAAGAPQLAEYFRRLGSYASPSKVNESEALQRGLDLTRCGEPEPRKVSVKRKGKDWVVTLPGYRRTTIRIAHADGRIRA